MRPKRFLRLFSGLLFLSFLGWVYSDGRLIRMIETGPPEYEWMVKPTHIGLNGQKVVFRVADHGSGVAELRTYIKKISEKPSSEKPISEEFYQNTPGSDVRLISMVVDPQRLDLEEGEYLLRVVARDFSVWNNEAVDEHRFVVDLTPPSLEVVSRHHYGRQGGTLAVFYRVHGELPLESGVAIGQRRFPGYPLSAATAGFEIPGQTYLVLAPVADTYSSETDGQFTIYGTDSAGNQTTVGFSPSIKQVALKKDSIRLSRSFLLKVLPNLGPLIDRQVRFENWGAADDKRLGELFRKVNNELRAENIQEIKRRSLSSDLQQMPGTLNKPIPAKMTASFGERRSYHLLEQNLGSSVHEGYDLASVEHDLVRSAGAGRVVHSGPLGIYGNAIVVAHGFGLSSLYGHLSSVRVAAGEHVDLGQELGNTGASGLAGGDHLHFEVRVHGEPVDPKEWLDPHWIKTRLQEPMELMVQANQ
jgi:murein DD-endopeptidase MepM/ murein hydrolase activator NlpD